MKRKLLLVLMLYLGYYYTAYAQGGTVNVQIVQTDAAISDSIWAEDPVTEEDTLFAVVTVPLSSDDAEEIWAVMVDLEPEIDDLNDDDLDMGWEGDPEDLNIVSIGLRFQDIAIPQGAYIDSAFIEVISHEEKLPEDVANITIWGEASANAETFTEDALITSRPKTSATISWIINTYWGLWTTERTPDIKSIIQEIVNQASWASGNALAIVMEGENQGVSDLDNAREFESFENISDPEEGGDGQNHPERVPKLIIHWSDTAPNEIGSMDSEDVFSIYPNPGKGFLSIEHSGITGSIAIFNITGNLVKSFELTAVTASLDISDLNKGIYFIQLSHNGNTTVQKLLVK